MKSFLYMLWLTSLFFLPSCDEAGSFSVRKGALAPSFKVYSKDIPPGKKAVIDSEKASVTVPEGAFDKKVRMSVKDQTKEELGQFALAAGIDPEILVAGVVLTTKAGAEVIAQSNAPIEICYDKDPAWQDKEFLVFSAESDAALPQKVASNLINIKPESICILTHNPNASYVLAVTDPKLAVIKETKTPSLSFRLKGGKTEVVAGEHLVIEAMADGKLYSIYTGDVAVGVESTFIEPLNAKASFSTKSQGQMAIDSLSLTKAGEYSVTMSDSRRKIISKASFKVRAAKAAEVWLDYDKTKALNGLKTDLALTVVDAFGNLVHDYAGDLNLTFPASMEIPKKLSLTLADKGRVELEDLVFPAGSVSFSVALPGQAAVDPVRMVVAESEFNKDPEPVVVITKVLKNPINASAAAINKTQINLNWEHEGILATEEDKRWGYAVSYQIGGAAPGSCAEGSPLTTQTDTTFLITGLSENTTYSFRLCAIADEDLLEVSSGITLTATTLGDESTPSVVNVTSSQADGVYKTGDVIVIRVSFSEAVIVTGSPRLVLETGADDGFATYTTGSGSDILQFSYTVSNGHSSSDLNYASTGSLQLMGGSISDGTNQADLTLPDLASGQTLADNKSIQIDSSLASVTDIQSDAAAASYTIGAELQVKVTFSKSVTVSGTPRLQLETGTVDRYATYVSGSGSQQLVFSYTVLSGDVSADLDYTATSALQLNGGSLVDELGNQAILTLPTPGAAQSLGHHESIVIDTAAPTITAVSSTAANGRYTTSASIPITVAFSEAVTVTGTPQLTLETGATDRTINYSSGSGTSQLTFTYNVQAGDTSNDLAYLGTSALSLNGGTIADAAGNGAQLSLMAVGATGSLNANKALIIDTTAPNVSSVTATNANGSYKAADTILIDIAFSEQVTVTGTPKLTLETGTADREANYSSGSGTSTLRFSYTIQGGDSASDLDYVSTSALALNGGSITDGANAATLTLPVPGATNSLSDLKHIAIDTSAPTIVSATTTAADGPYKAGDSIPVVVTFSEAVTVAGTPQLTLETGTVDQTINYSSGSTTTELIFSYTVSSGDTAADLDYKATNALSLNGGSILDATGNAASLTLPAPGSAGSLAANQAVVIDTTAPSVSHVDSTLTAALYSLGAVIPIRIHFTEVVQVTGTPQLQLETGTIDQLATYVSGSGSSELIFNYTVQNGDFSADLAYQNTASLDLNGGTITDPVGHNGVLTLPAPGATGSLNANEDLMIDSTAPVVDHVTASTANGIYRQGDTITIEVVFSENVDVTGTPQLTLETGTTDRMVNYVSGSGSTTLVFTYTVQAGDNSADLDVQSSNALSLNGGTVKDSGLNDVSLALPAPGATGSLGANKALVVDTTSPTVSSVTSSAADQGYKAGDSVSIQVVFSEVVHVTGTPQLTLETGITDRVVDYASGTGSTTLTFAYTVQAGDTSADLDYVATTSLVLNGGTIQDAALNNATLTLASPGAADSLGANKAIIIDTTAPTVSSVSASTANGSYKAGEVIAIQVSFAESVYVTGTPQLTLETGTTDRMIDYSSGSGSSTLLFNYTVQGGDVAADLDYVSTGSLSLNGGTILDIGANAATLTLPSPGAANSLGANKAIVIDTTAPTVSSVSSSTANGTYKLAQVIAVTIAFSESVVVSGTPQLTLETGTSDQVVDYSSGSGTATLTFNYTIGSGHTSSDLDYLSTTALALNGGSILDMAGNPATLTLANPGAANSLGANKAIVVDGAVPTVTNVTSSKANGTYKAGEVIAVSVTFSEAVTVTGAPYITLETGSLDVGVSYSSGSGTSTLVFSYTVAMGHISSDLDYKATSSLNLNGGTIRDSSTNNATLTLPSPGAAGSLSANKAIVIDAVRPDVTLSSSVTSPTNLSSFVLSIVFTESVTGFVVGDITVSGATLSSFTGSGDSYAVTVTPTTGNITIDVSTTAASDAAGNTNLAADQFAMTYLPDPTSFQQEMASSSTSISLSWASGGGATGGYVIAYQSGTTAPATCALGTVISSGSITGTSHTIGSLTADQYYSFRLCAKDSGSASLSPGITATYYAHKQLLNRPTTLSDVSPSQWIAMDWHFNALLGVAIDSNDTLYRLVRDPEANTVSISTSFATTNATGVKALKFSPDGRYIYVLGTNGSIDYHDAASASYTYMGTVSNARTDATDMIMPIDGRDLYVASQNSGKIAAYTRNVSSGALTLAATITDDAGGFSGLGDIRDIYFSHDGLFLYAAGYGDSAVTVLARNISTGALTFVEKKTLAGASSFAISMNNQYLYAASSTSHTISIYTRTHSSGALTLSSTVTAPSSYLTGVKLLALTGNGRYILASNGSNIIAFRVNLGTGALALRQIYADGENNMDAWDDVTEIVGLPDEEMVTILANSRFYVLTQNIKPVAFGQDLGASTNTSLERYIASPDGRHVYAAMDGVGMRTYSVNQSTFALTLQQTLTNCPADGYGTAAVTNCLTERQNSDLAVTADGKFLYYFAKKLMNNATVIDGGVVVFSRNPDTGLLTFVQNYISITTGFDADLANPYTGAVSRDGRHVYAYGAGTANPHQLTFTRNLATGVITKAYKYTSATVMNHTMDAVISRSGLMNIFSNYQDDRYGVLYRNVSTGAVSSETSYTSATFLNQNHNVEFTPDDKVILTGTFRINSFLSSAPTTKVTSTTARTNAPEWVVGTTRYVYEYTDDATTKLYIYKINKNTGSLTLDQTLTSGVELSQAVSSPTNYLAIPALGVLIMGRNIIADYND